NVENGTKVKAGHILAKIPRAVGKTRDITGGLPRVVELFEARNPSNPAVVSEIDGVDNDFVRAGAPLSDGAITPSDILNIQGPGSVQEYLVNEIQEVYRLQGVKINDKHIEVIVRQMMQKVLVMDAGDTSFLENQLVDKGSLMEENDTIIDMKETTKVLSEAAIRGKADELLGLKENVIVGHLIPAGTGLREYQGIEVTSKEDLAARQNAAAAEPAAPAKRASHTNQAPIEDFYNSRFQVGQVWEYQTRLVDPKSTLQILKVQRLYGTTIAVHIQPLPEDYKEGYETWYNAFMEVKAGVFTMPVARVVNMIEETMSGTGQNFIRMMPGVPKAKVKARIVLTPEHAKRLLSALEENIQRFEQSYGPIKLHQETPSYPMNFGGAVGEA
nr:hypothetical protein [Tanacetum cinerariifolium]